MVIMLASPAELGLGLRLKAVFQTNSNDCILVRYAYVLSFRPVTLQIRTIPVRLVWIGLS